MKNRIISVTLVLIIACYGIMGTFILPVFQSWIESILLFIDADLLKKLQIFFTGSKYQTEDRLNLGKWLIYIPSYLTLHFLLLNTILSRANRIKGSLIFLSIILAFISFRLFCHFLKIRLFDELFNYSLYYLLNLPILLFLIEGGKILISDLKKFANK